MVTYRLVGADVNTMKDCAANRVKAIDDEILIEESGKLRFLVQLMARLKQEGHRTLIFSLSRKMLDIIQKVSGIQAVVRLGLVCRAGSINMSPSIVLYFTLHISV